MNVEIMDTNLLRSYIQQDCHKFYLSIHFGEDNEF